MHQFFVIFEVPLSEFWAENRIVFFLELVPCVLCMYIFSGDIKTKNALAGLLTLNLAYVAEWRSSSCGRRRLARRQMSVDGTTRNYLKLIRRRVHTD